MSRSQAPVSDRVWAQALHAVTSQHLSLRRAAQLYGMHHMALHRRVLRVRQAMAESQTSASADRSQPTPSAATPAPNVLHWPALARGLPGPDPESDYTASPSSSASPIIGRLGSEDARPRGLKRTRSAAGADDDDRQSPDCGELEDDRTDTTSHSGYTAALAVSPSRPYRETNDVPNDVWEQAINAVELHGMSLRSAAKAYGVHFAALYRRVKKRSDQRRAVVVTENYIPFEDEAGIIRVVRAYAEIGLFMRYEELLELLHRTAMKYTPIMTEERSQLLIQRFLHRAEVAVHHLIHDWPSAQAEMVPPLRTPAASASMIQSEGYRALGNEFRS